MKPNVLLKEKLADFSLTLLRTIFSSLYSKKSSLIPDLEKFCLPLFIMTLITGRGYTLRQFSSVQFLLNVTIECLPLEVQCTLPY